MAISIREVAVGAGVSMSTVSRVLSGSARAQIALATQERVQRVAAELGYRPNRLAQSLITGRTDTIGLMIAGFRNPFFVGLMESAEQMVLEAGFQSLLDPAPSHRGSFREHGRLQSWPVDGVLMWAEVGQKIGDYLGPQMRDVPVVYLGSQPRGKLDGDTSHHAENNIEDAVIYDLNGGARAAALHVLERGYRKLAHVVPYDSQELTDDARSRAFAHVCREADVPLETIVATRREETRQAGWQTGLEVAARPQSKRPRALLCHNDVMAVGVYHGLKRGGVRVPNDIALVGVDGIEEGRFLDRPLTTVEAPIDLVCRRAMEILLRRIAGDRELEPQHIVPTSLFIGETT